jgi:hypothetical protein
LCDTYNLVLSLDGPLWREIEERLVAKFSRILEGADVDAVTYAKMVRQKMQISGPGEISSASRPLWEQVDFLYIFERLNRYFGGLSSVAEILKTHLEFSPFDFIDFEPKVKHLGLTHYAQGRSLAMDVFSKPLTSAAAANRTLRKLKEARNELLQVLSSSPENQQSLLLLGRLELWPISHFARIGDLHLVAQGLDRALEHLEQGGNFVFFV